MLLDTKRKLN